MKKKIVSLGMLVCLLALSFGLVSCGGDDGGGGNVNSVKITGLEGKSGSVVLWIQYTKDDTYDRAEATISSNQVTFTFPTAYSGNPLANGSYYIKIDVESFRYVYTNGSGTDGDGSVGGSYINNTAAVKIDLSGDATIGFDKFKKD